MLSENHMYHIDCSPGDVGRYVLLPGDPGRVPKIAAYLDNAKQVTQNREYNVYTGTLEGEKVSVVSTGIGGPSAAIALEELHQIGADTFIRIGTAGGMQTEVLAGDLVIATGAIRMDGTGKEYVPVEYPAVADYQAVAALLEAAAESGKKYHTGVVECKDSFYGQHQPSRMPVGYELENKWQAWIKAGALASEMESATLFIVAGILRARIGTVLFVVNNQEREAKGLKNIVQQDTTAAIEVGVLAMRRLIQSDKALGH